MNTPENASPDFTDSQSQNTPNTSEIAMRILELSNHQRIHGQPRRLYSEESENITRACEKLTSEVQVTKS